MNDLTLFRMWLAELRWTPYSASVVPRFWSVRNRAYLG